MAAAAVQRFDTLHTASWAVPISLPLFTNIWADWTLRTFALLGFTPLLVAVGFDEIDRLYSLWFMILLTLLMSGTARLYLRSGRPSQRTAALVCRLVICILTVAVGSTLYWLPSGGVYVPGMAAWTVVVVGVMLAPALIGLRRRGRRSA
jgi:hypothetical protein